MRSTLHLIAVALCACSTPGPGDEPQRFTSYEASAGQPDAARGRALVVDIVRENGIDEFYVNGRGSTFWLPETVWPELTEVQRDHVRAYVATKSRSTWRIGLGRLHRNEADGKLDILSDRIIEESNGPVMSSPSR